MKYCPLDMTWLLHTSTHSNYSQLPVHDQHRIKLVKIQDECRRVPLGTTWSGGVVGNRWLWRQELSLSLGDMGDRLLIPKQLTSHPCKYKHQYSDSRFLITIKNRRHEVERGMGCGNKESWKEVVVDGCEQYTLHKCIKASKV